MAGRSFPLVGTSYQVDNIVVRNIFLNKIVTDSFPSANYTLFSDGQGGTYWSTFSSLTYTSFNQIAGDSNVYLANNVTNRFTLKSGPGMGQVESPLNERTITLYSKGIQGISTNTGGVLAFNNNFLNPIVTFSSTRGIDILAYSQCNVLEFNLDSTFFIQESTNNTVLASTIDGLGTFGYLSSIYFSPELQLLSTTVSIAASTVSTILVPTVDTIVTSTTIGLGTLGYLSTVGDVAGISTALSLGLSSVYNGIVDNVIPSTCDGLGSLGYFSDIQGYFGVSSVIGPGLSTVFSTLSTVEGIFQNDIFPSTIAGLGSIGYVSTLSDFSTIRTSTIFFADYASTQINTMFTSSSRLYYNSTIIGGTVVLPVQFITFSDGSPGVLATVNSVSFAPYDFAAKMEFFGNVVAEGSSPVVQRGVVWNISGNPTIADNIVTDYSGGLGSYSDQFYVPYDLIYARGYASNAVGVAYGAELTAFPNICLAKGTLITMADKSTKAIEDITYTDDLLVWNFDNGCLDTAKPLWIKKAEVTTQYNLLQFSDGSHLKTINQHRIFNKEKGAFTYPMTEDTPIGTGTVNVHGQEVALVSKEVVQESVEYYNVITEKHINLYANGILTSCRYNNLYPIVDMKFVKEERTVVSKTLFGDIDAKYYDGLRLSEQIFPIKDTLTYIQRLELTKV